MEWLFSWNIKIIILKILLDWKYIVQDLSFTCKLWFHWWLDQCTTWIFFFFVGGRDVTLKTCLLRILLFLTKSITWCLQSNVFILNYFYLRKFLVFSQVFRKYYLFLCNYNWNIFNYITECCKKKKNYFLYVQYM